MTTHKRAKLTALVLSMAVIAACGPVLLDVRPPMRRTQHTESAPTLAQQQFTDKNCGEHGVPRLSRTHNFGPTTLIHREGYVLEHSATDRIAIWVCEGYDSSQWSGSTTKRKDNFRPDPLLREQDRAQLAHYKGSKMDRGHMAPAADFNDQKLKDESFFLSNMAPQAPNLNQQFWRRLEDEVRNWARADSPIHVFTGGFFYDEDEDTDKADGQVKYQRIGANREVAVPTHFYKIVFGTDASGKPRAVGFVVANKPHNKDAPFADSIKSVQWIEERTGVEFMPNLSDQLKRELKGKPGSIW